MSLTGVLGPILGIKQKVQLIQRTPNSASVIELDCTVRENHSRQSPASDYPIENGASISDNILIRPIELELNGIISDTPIDAGAVAVSALTSAVSNIAGPLGVVGAAGGVALFQALQGTGKISINTYEQLLRLQEARAPFEVFTTLVPKKYQNMWIKSLSVPRDASTGQVLAFNLSLIQLLLVSSQTVNVKIFSNPSVAAGKAKLSNNPVSPISQEFINKAQAAFSDFRSVAP